MYTGMIIWLGSALLCCKVSQCLKIFGNVAFEFLSLAFFANFYPIKSDLKCKRSSLRSQFFNATFSVIFKHCEYDSNLDKKTLFNLLRFCTFIIFSNCMLFCKYFLFNNNYVHCLKITKMSHFSIWDYF